MFSELLVVEVTGFEPATFWSRTKRATKLRYTSIFYGANEGIRTLDLRFTKPLLCLLSYIGVYRITGHYYTHVGAISQEDETIVNIKYEKERNVKQFNVLFYFFGKGDVIECMYGYKANGGFGNGWRKESEKRCAAALR